MPSRVRLYLRNRLPRSVRHLVRLAGHIVPRGKPAAQIPTELFADCRVCASRRELATKFPRGARIAEVGTFRGAFARHILNACAPAELHVIDLDLSQLDPAIAKDARVRVHSGASHRVLAGFPDAHFDWIYIDADHSYEGLLRDANAAAIRPRPAPAITGVSPCIMTNRLTSDVVAPNAMRIPISVRRWDERAGPPDGGFELELRVWPGPPRLAAHVDPHGNRLDWLLA